MGFLAQFSGLAFSLHFSLLLNFGGLFHLLKQALTQFWRAFAISFGRLFHLLNLAGFWSILAGSLDQFGGLLQSVWRAFSLTLAGFY